ncbi:MAG: 30S ribosomal protein S12 methylthiotransferase RimO [Planctomycetes bacterium]|nr:30S ribosomal protein S12 methylthiotransferase RimO [Planctomycetota bacterium]
MPRTKRNKSIERVAFVSLGCPKNLVDSEKMLSMLREGGLTPVNESDSPDALVVNTCGFLEASKEESLEVIHDALRRKDRGELKRVVVAGCLVQRHRAKILEWAPGVDSMIGVFDRDRVVEAVTGITPSRTELGSEAERPPYWIAANALQAAKDRGRTTVGLTVNGADGRGVGYFESDANRFRLTPRHWAYLRASEGCNQRCAFCTIPSIRGKMRSKSLDETVAEAGALMDDGAFELNIIGQDTTSWGFDIGDERGLPGLLAALDRTAQEHGGGWIRLMYAYPSKFTDEMIDAIASLPSVVKYLDMPLQHASDSMLELMRRRITGDETRDLLGRLRKRIPNLALRTTFIVGHPGETEKDFEQLLEFVREQKFEMAGCFKYSHEEGTPSGTMNLDPKLHVPPEESARREEELMLLQQEIAFEHVAAMAKAKKRLEVLIDAPDPERARKGEHAYIGRAWFQAPQVDSSTVVRSKREFSPGELVMCEAFDSDGYDLVARPEDEAGRSISLPMARTRRGH